MIFIEHCTVFAFINMFYRKGNVYERWVDGRFRLKTSRVRYVNTLTNNFFCSMHFKQKHTSACTKWKFPCRSKENNHVFLCAIFDTFLSHTNEIWMGGGGIMESPCLSVCLKTQCCPPHRPVLLLHIKVWIFVSVHMLKTIWRFILAIFMKIYVRKDRMILWQLSFSLPYILYTDVEM